MYRLSEPRNGSLNTICAAPDTQVSFEDPIMNLDNGPSRETGQFLALCRDEPQAVSHAASGSQ